MTFQRTDLARAIMTALKTEIATPGTTAPSHAIQDVVNTFTNNPEEALLIALQIMIQKYAELLTGIHGTVTATAFLDQTLLMLQVEDAMTPGANE